jgi:hypothetical protein
MQGSPTTAELYSAILMLSERVDHGFTEVGRRFSGIDQRIAQMDQRLNTRIDDLGKKLREEMKTGFERL